MHHAWLISLPVSNSVDQPLIAALSWNTAIDAFYYRLQLSENADFSTLVMDDLPLTGISISTDSLANNTTYYWRVNAINAGGTSDWSQVWSDKFHAMGYVTKAVDKTRIAEHKALIESGDKPIKRYKVHLVVE